MNYWESDPAAAATADYEAMTHPAVPGDQGTGHYLYRSLRDTGKGLLQNFALYDAVKADATNFLLSPAAKSLDGYFGGTKLEDMLAENSRATLEAVHDLMPGPDATVLGQLGYGAATVLPQAVIGGAVAGPLGAAALPGLLQTYTGARIGATYEGLDPTTALEKGAVEGAFTAAGVLIPGGFGARTVTSAALGAGANVGVGMAERASVSALLEARGYHDMAQQYRAVDGSQIAVDAVLGSAFGVLHARGARAEAPVIPPSAVDAALAANKQDHLEVSTAPGVPSDPASRSLHAKAVEKAMNDVMHDEPVDVSATGVDSAAFVPNRSEMQAHVEAAVAEEGTIRSTLASVDELRAEVERLGLTPADERLFEGEEVPPVAARAEVRDALDAQGARDLPGAAHGRDGEVFVGERAQPVRFMVVEADALAATIAKADNQFRDRTRAASQQQIAKIASDLQFGRLGEAPTMAEGAPTLAQSGEIIGGNGRVAAVQQAYSRGLGDAYRVALEQRAAEFGLTPEQIQGFTRPILVRQFTVPMDIRAAAILSNEGGALRMSALEQARVDAERMPALSGVEMPASGDLGAASLRDFRNQWLAQYPQAELGEFVDAEGKLSPQGEARLRNAILYAAYGDSPTLARLVESTDDLSKNLAGALVKSSANVAEARAAIEAGDLHDLDIQPHILSAIDTAHTLRAKGTKLEDYLAQNDMFGAGIGPEATLLLTTFQKNTRSQKAVAEVLTGYYDAVRALGDPKQATMFEAPPPSRGEILRAVIEKRPIEAEGLDAGAALRQAERATDPTLAQLDAVNRGTLLDLYAAAEREKPAFDAKIAALAEQFGGRPMLAPLKGVGRAVAKVAADYRGNASKIGDILRATVAVDSVEQARAAAAQIEKDYELVGKSRNLFAEGAASPDGYRDAMYKVKAGDGIVAEIQVSIPEILDAKHRVHDLYEQRSALEREIGDKQETPAQRATIDRLNAEMRVAYDAAFAEASARASSTKDAKTLGETGAPLRRSEAASKGRGGSVSQAATYPTPGTPRETGMPSTSKSSALAGMDETFMSASESSIPHDAENATMSASVEQVLHDMPNAQVVGLDGESMPAGLAIAQVDAKIATTAKETSGIEAAAACALR